MIYINGIYAEGTCHRLSIDTETGLTYYLDGWVDGCDHFYIEPLLANSTDMNCTIRYKMNSSLITWISFDIVCRSLIKRKLDNSILMPMNGIQRGLPILDIDRLSKDADTGNVGKGFTFHKCNVQLMYSRSEIVLQLTDNPSPDLFTGVDQLAFGITDDQAISHICIHSLSEVQYVEFDAWARSQKLRMSNG